ncbi:hypothetical protein SprV_0902665100 [Sparganum proliferum]
MPKKKGLLETHRRLGPTTPTANNFQHAHGTIAHSAREATSSDTFGRNAITSQQHRQTNTPCCHVCLKFHDDNDDHSYRRRSHCWCPAALKDWRYTSASIKAASSSNINTSPTPATNVTTSDVRLANTFTPTAPTTENADSIPTWPYCDLTFTLSIGLAGHL